MTQVLKKYGVPFWKLESEIYAPGKLTIKKYRYYSWRVEINLDGNVMYAGVFGDMSPVKSGRMHATRFFGYGNTREAAELNAIDFAINEL